MAEISSQRANSWDAPSAGPVTQHATIGASIVIKGDVSGKEHLFVDGTVEGSIHFPEHRVTVGRGSKVTANIYAREVVVMGMVKGDIHCADLLDIRADSHIQGQIAACRLRIDDGAILKGSVAIQRAEKDAQAAPKAVPDQVKAQVVEPPPAVASESPAAPDKQEPSKAHALAEAVTRRVAGSSVLFKPVR